ncbi:MAG: molecular chaperone GrpE [Paraglaciecola sp.]
MKRSDMKAEKEEKAKKEVVEGLVEEQADDVSTPETVGDSEEEEDVDPMEELQGQVAEAKDKYLRLYSEFENFRRRTSKEKLELISTAGRELMEALLPVMDDFERSMRASVDIGENEGVKLIYHKFSKVLEAKGLNKMEINPGDEFDEEKHEAITQIPAPDKKLAGKIVDVVEPGYYLGEKVIRYGKVVTGAKD